MRISWGLVPCSVEQLIIKFSHVSDIFHLESRMQHEYKESDISYMKHSRAPDMLKSRIYTARVEYLIWARKPSSNARTQIHTCKAFLEVQQKIQTKLKQFCNCVITINHSHNSFLYLIGRVMPGIPIVVLAKSIDSAPSLFSVKKYTRLCLTDSRPHSHRSQDISTPLVKHWSIQTTSRTWQTFNHWDRTSKFKKISDCRSKSRTR